MVRHSDRRAIAYLLVRELDAFVVLAIRVEEVHARRGAVVCSVASWDVLLQGHDVPVSSDSACFVVEALDDTVFAARDVVEAHRAGVADGA